MLLTLGLGVLLTLGPGMLLTLLPGMLAVLTLGVGVLALRPGVLLRADCAADTRTGCAT